MRSIFWVVAASAALVACGAGGLTAAATGTGTGTGTSTPDSLLGIYSGASVQGSISKSIYGVFLNSGEYYFAEFVSGQAAELVHGTSVPQGGTLNSNDMMDFPAPLNPLSGSFAGTYVLNSGVNGSLNYANNVVTPQNLTLTYQTNSNAQQLLTAVARSWSFTDNATASGTLTVGVNGNITGSTSTGCTLSGNMLPGNAAYALSLNMTNCTVSGSLTGVAVLPPGTNNLILMALTPTRNGAWVALAN
ncbi:MAG: hypothetical protein HKM02_06685 [Pseudomonadales bacterium]|nr:hypothetical protein [Pseudomonadales bacterium]